MHGSPVDFKNNGTSGSCLRGWLLMCWRRSGMHSQTRRVRVPVLPLSQTYPTSRPWIFWNWISRSHRLAISPLPRASLKKQLNLEAILQGRLPRISFSTSSCVRISVPCYVFAAQELQRRPDGHHVWGCSRRCCTVPCIHPAP